MEAVTRILAFLPTPIEVDFLAVRDAFNAEISVEEAQVGAWDLDLTHHTVEIVGYDASRFEILVQKDGEEGWFVGSVTIRV
jgi:hypothetical protein